MRADSGDSAGAIDKNGAVLDCWCCYGVNAAGANPQTHSAEALIFLFSFSASVDVILSGAKDLLWIRKQVLRACSAQDDMPACSVN